MQIQNLHNVFFSTVFWKKLFCTDSISTVPIVNPTRRCFLPCFCFQNVWLYICTCTDLLALFLVSMATDHLTLWGRKEWLENTKLDWKCVFQLGCHRIFVYVGSFVQFNYTQKNNVRAFVDIMSLWEIVEGFKRLLVFMCVQLLYIRDVVDTLIDIWMIIISPVVRFIFYLSSNSQCFDFIHR